MAFFVLVTCIWDVAASSLFSESSAKWVMLKLGGRRLMLLAHLADVGARPAYETRNVRIGHVCMFGGPINRMKPQDQYILQYISLG